jgi:nucleotide-binding universal stress UspA family protein
VVGPTGLEHSPVSESNQGAFRRAVVGVNGGPGDVRTLRLACELAKAHRAELVVVHVVEIDWTRPLDADVASQDQNAQRVLEQAEMTAEAAHQPVETVLLQARDVGAAIVDEALERDADLIVLSLPYRKRFGGEFVMGRTIPYCFKNAPCRVWVIREAQEESA